MEDRRILISLVIAGALIVIRLSFYAADGLISLQIMSAINIIAFDYILHTIFTKAQNRMICIHNKVTEELNKDNVRNWSIISFAKLKTKIFIFLSFATILYIAWGGNSIINDILTIISLILSIEDDTFGKKLGDWYYSPT
ncbi:MAG TPA: hypothetical protein VEF53_06715 [Patescibacteria group bacterium]|nr:hypothetical protein [Patescibacteria group bacterium]